MNFEQKYKEALERAREELGSGCFDKGTVEYIFPELKESEDEKIRKSIIELLNEVRFTFKYYDINKMLAWLEKQKPSNEALQYLKENHSQSDVNDFKAAMNIAIAKAFDAGKKAQKLVEWSEEDETKLKDAIKCVHHIHTDFDHNRFFVTLLSYTLSEIEGWLKSLTPKSH